MNLCSKRWLCLQSGKSTLGGRQGPGGLEWAMRETTRARTLVVTRKLTRTDGGERRGESRMQSLRPGTQGTVGLGGDRKSNFGLFKY